MIDFQNIADLNYRCRIDWGRRGARRAAARGDIMVIVDVLSFSSMVATALHNNISIYPCTMKDDTVELARRIGGEAAVGRKDVPQKGRFSLSPLTYSPGAAGSKVIVASPNGATCCRFADQASYLFCGGLLNARSVAEEISRILTDSDLAVTIIACGEREKEPGEDGPIRFAVEDYLGAGAILSEIEFEKSPDAMVCEAAFLNSRDNLSEIIRTCPSGVELRDCGFGEDVSYCANLNIFDIVPVLENGFFVNRKRQP